MNPSNKLEQTSRFLRSRLLSLGLVFSLYSLILKISIQAVAVQAQPSTEGQWEVLTINGVEVQWPEVPIHMAVLPTGKVLFWGGGDDAPGRDTTPTFLWDPNAPTTPPTQVLNSASDVFCSGHTFLRDGQLLVAGGHIHDSQGLKNTNTFNPFTQTWSKSHPMNAGRWYPTTTSLGDGGVVVASGATSPNVVNDLPQVYKGNKWRSLTTARRSLPLYPWMYSAVVQGKAVVFYSGPEAGSLYLDTTGTGAWTPGPTTSGLYRDYGSSVMYEPNKVLIVGGGDPPTNGAQVIDLTIAPPKWRSVASMTSFRRHLNATILPDGKVLVTGGTSSGGFNNAEPGGVIGARAAEMWDPASEAWSTMAAMKYQRIYHSTAVLLLDGRVLVGGGGRPSPVGQPNRYDVEIYSPPYLFQTGVRPQITSAPSTVSYGQTFSVATPDVASIAKVTWIRLSSVTHAFNQNQRINRLSFMGQNNTLTITAPSDSNLAPPGHYMLFIVNNLGVPSVAKIIQIP